MTRGLKVKTSRNEGRADWSGQLTSSSRVCVPPRSRSLFSRVCTALWEKARGRESWVMGPEPALRSATPDEPSPGPFSSEPRGAGWGSVGRVEKKRVRDCSWSLGLNLSLSPLVSRSHSLSFVLTHSHSLTLIRSLSFVRSQSLALARSHSCTQRKAQPSLTSGFGHAPLPHFFASGDSPAFGDGLLPVLVAPLPVRVRLKVSLLNLREEGRTAGRRGGSQERGHQGVHLTTHNRSQDCNSKNS